MRQIQSKLITETVKKLCIDANCYLPRDMKECIEQCHAEEPWPQAKEILERIIENYKLAEEGLIDAIATHTRRYIEDIPPHIMREDDPTKIDIEKFKDYAIHGEYETSTLYWDNNCYAPFRNSRGIIPGPTSFEDNVKQGKEFSDKFGIRVYHEMCNMCRTAEAAKQNIDRLYKAGGEAITMFNTCMLSHDTVLWNYLGKSGHKDEFSDLELCYKEYKKTKILEFDGVNMNRFKPLWGG